MKEKLRKPLTALMMAWGTYLAIPCPYKVWDDALRPWQIVCLPPVGLVVGGIWALCAGIFAKLGFTGFLAAAILAAVPFLVTGFFHLDGFLDCCDAILSRRDLATRQKILKDSRVGAFAVVSAVLLFLLSFAALADCSFSLIWRALLLIPVVTRCMAGVAVETFAPMQTSQYAGSFAAGETKTQRRILLGMYIAVMFVVFLWLFKAQLRAGGRLGGTDDDPRLPSGQTEPRRHVRRYRGLFHHAGRAFGASDPGDLLRGNDMILIIGGAYQGKTAYAKQTYGLQDADIFTCEGLALDPAARCVRHLERFALACVQAGKEPADELRTLDLSDKILLCEDISCGVVPIDPEQRAWREAVGRMNAMLAARAERVTRIFCGLPMELKG